MGFFDNLFSQETKDKLSKLSKQIDEFSEKAVNVVDEVAGDVADGISKAVKSTSAAPANNTVNSRLEKIFSSEYSSYEVKKEVSPTTIGGEGNFRPYTYGLYLDGSPKAFIMVTEHNKEVLRTFRWSKEAAQNAGIPFINFLTQFPNTEEYIKNRLAQNIK